MIYFISIKFLILGLLLFHSNLFSDEYHNINGFFGERATGMAGAFTAISDDATGSYYNPGGLGFINNTSYTINASTYQIKNLKNQDFFGPGQNYTQSSKNFMPNFIGFVKKFDNFTIGISILTKINESFDQSDRVALPLYLRRTSQLDVSIVRDNLNILGGPSIGYAISSKLSIGITSYYDHTSSRTIMTTTQNEKNNTTNTSYMHEQRRINAFQPILGIQYMPTDKISMGVSLRRNFIYSGNIDSKRNSTSTGLLGSAVYHGSEHGTAEIRSNETLIYNPLSYRMPEIMEFRTGVAYFLNSSLLMSVDTIYSSGYKMFQDQNIYLLNANSLSITNPNVNTFTREQTLNYAIGLEYFLTESIVIRIGYLTNYSNSKKIQWREEALLSALRNQRGDNFVVPISPNLTYNFGDKRSQYIDLFGTSLGIGYETHNSSFSISAIYQRGQGMTILDRFQLPTTTIYTDLSFYLSGSSKY